MRDSADNDDDAISLSETYGPRPQSTSSPLARQMSARPTHAAVCMLHNRISPFSLAEVSQAASVVCCSALCRINWHPGETAKFLQL